MSDAATHFSTATTYTIVVSNGVIESVRFFTRSARVWVSAKVHVTSQSYTASVWMDNETRAENYICGEWVSDCPPDMSAFFDWIEIEVKPGWHRFDLRGTGTFDRALLEVSTVRPFMRVVQAPSSPSPSPSASEDK